MADNDLWEKPAWAKGGVKLKKTGFGDAMKEEGNLAAPITFTPFKNDDHSNQVANQERLRKTQVGALAKQGENLAAPITFTPFKVRYFANYMRPMSSGTLFVAIYTHQFPIFRLHIE
jgi:hypothetical protein